MNRKTFRVKYKVLYFIFFYGYALLVGEGIDIISGWSLEIATVQVLTLGELGNRLSSVTTQLRLPRIKSIFVTLDIKEQ